MFSRQKWIKLDQYAREMRVEDSDRGMLVRSGLLQVGLRPARDRVAYCHNEAFRDHRLPKSRVKTVYSTSPATLVYYELT